MKRLAKRAAVVGVALVVLMAPTLAYARGHRSSGHHFAHVTTHHITASHHHVTTHRGAKHTARRRRR